MNEPLTIGALFAGIGGLELGLGWAFAEAGIPHRVAWQVEIETFPRSVLARHWPDADRSVTDVRNAGSASLVPVDLICGGFPCQDLSYAGKGAGIAEGTRSGLWYEYARVVRELRPRIVVVENVGALLARGLGIVLGDLAALGYDAEWRCVRASDVGAPHRRERLFIVAHARGEQCGDTAERLPGRAREADALHGGPSMADADPLREQQPQGLESYERGRARDGGEAMADPDSSGRRQDAGRSGPQGVGIPLGRDALADAASEGRSRAERRRAESGGTRSVDGSGSERAEPESGMGRATHGLPRWLDRWPSGPGEAQHEWEAPRVAKGVANRAAQLKAYGNAVVPAVSREVGRWIIGMGLVTT